MIITHNSHDVAQLLN